MKRMWIALLAPLAVLSPAHAADLKPYCVYNPDWSVFKAGKEVVQHSHSSVNSSPGAEDNFDTYEILLPRVTHSLTLYDSPPNRRIPLKKGDRVEFGACGCVQTGGKGKTWKRYVNPSGANSDRLYHGGVILENAAELGLPTSPTVPSMVRFKDLLAWQASGKRVRIARDATLILGYEDDSYGDNSYQGHDNGNDDQCQGVGSAAVQVTIRH